MDINKIQHLLKKYQENSCSEDEYLLVDRWLDKNVNEEQTQNDEQSMETNLSDIKRNIDRQIKVKRFIGYRFLRIAAVFLICASIIGFFIFTGNKNAEFRAKVKQIHIESVGGWIKISTPKGLTHEFDLPDGSHVVLNASSKIRYPARFLRLKRPVYLDEGEAYFSVFKDKKKPFTVYTSNCSTTALGTAFNVRSYKNENVVSVALVHGKVRVDDLKVLGNQPKSRFLKPNQQIILHTKSNQVERKVFQNTSAITGWSKGLMAFDNASVEEVVTTIENRFDVTINSNLKNDQWKYTGTFKDENLQEIMETICLTEGVKFKMLSKNSIQIN
ncbi:FecR family protein [Arcticibacter eurypsychrophilus]|uniref:FecR family protein n=1 Tax=Arcticibacter eurypsychrophilus TaxID=1434752 RepID=UPI0014798CFB|nr:FecR family protein [Arcticibacter eurypsychrophilus]